MSLLSHASSVQSSSNHVPSSSSQVSNTSGKSIGREETYVQPDTTSYSQHMLNLNPDDITPDDSASNDPLTKFNILGNASKSDSNSGVSMDGPPIRYEDQVDFNFAKGLKASGHLDVGVNVRTTNGKKKSKDEPPSVSASSARKSRLAQMNDRSVDFDIPADSSDEEDYVSDGASSCECDHSENCKYRRRYLRLKKNMKRIAKTIIAQI
uniref:NSP5 n=1 Tax=Rotavirus A TaxID=28875 RepID=A0A650D7A7_9REOV|nr:NSP5 [Rotavirus A]